MPSLKQRYHFELGTSYVGMVNVETDAALEVPPHPWVYRDGSKRYTRGDAYEYYDGYPQAEWHFDFLRLSAWQWLVAFFTGTAQTVAVYLRTKTTADTFSYFTALMHKPEMGSSASRAVRGYSDVTVRFTKLAAYTP